MFDEVPDLTRKSCPVEAGKYMFLTSREIQIGKTAQDLRDWINEGFQVLDFPFPRGLDIDCNTAREILKRAELKN